MDTDERIELLEMVRSLRKGPFMITFGDHTCSRPDLWLGSATQNTAFGDEIEAAIRPILDRVANELEDKALTKETDDE